MEIIYDKPRTGKTTKLIKKCAENDGYIVCKDKQRVKEVAQMAKSMGLRIPYPLTFYELISKEYYAQGIRKIYIDNADELIKMIAPGLEVECIVMDNLEEYYGK